MPAHLIRRRRKARSLGFLAASLASGAAALAVSSGGGIDQSPEPQRTSLTSQATVLGAIVRSPASLTSTPAAPAASVVTIPAPEPTARRAPRRAGPSATATPSPTLVPPVSVTAPGRTTTTTAPGASTSTTSTTEGPSTTVTTAAP